MQSASKLFLLVTLQLAVLSKLEILPGRAAEHEAYVKNDTLPAVKKSGRIGPPRASVVFGGTGLLSFAPEENFANLARGSAQASAQVAGLSGTVRNNGTALPPDLSILPK